MDLDRFKEVNDRLGHAAGDFLLKEVAQRLRHSVRQEDLAARIGGDEFILLITHLSRDEKTVRREVQRVIDNIKKAFAAPVVYQNELLQIGFSAGIALFPRPEIDPEHSLNQADNALYQAKKLGRGLAVFFDEADQPPTKP